ncbi:MAG: solute carrier family 23 protein [Spirochaetales bacterium]|nr:solute carrier family 23 protein [Spirochaetales bacterium]
MSNEAKNDEGWVIYPIGSKPKWGLSFLLGAQQFLTQFGSTVIIPTLVGGAMGLPPEELALLISTMFFCAGITTLIQQSPLGNGLPILQGGTFSFLGPMFAIVGMCSAQGLGYEIMIQQVCASVMIASLFEIIIGYTGLMGLIKKAFSPIVIGPTIAMIGLALYNCGAPWMAGNWVISIITFVAIVLFSQVFARKSKIFALFPILLAVILGWVCSLIGTLAGWIPEGNPANLKNGLDLIGSAPYFWIKPAIPFKWGFPSFNAITFAGALGMLAGYIGSMIESVGDYYSCARIAEAPVPTAKIISKGIGAEGLGCLVASIFQTCNGTTSYSENIGSIGLTRVASRRVIRCAGIILLVLPFFGKFGMVLATLPQPIVGALFFAMFGLIAATGLSNLQFTNLNNARNLFIIGVGFFAGLTIPFHFGANSIVTGEAGSAAYVLTNIFQTIFTTGMAVTAIITMILDNLLPGATREERGLTVWESEASDEAWEKAEAEWAKLEVGKANWHNLK